MTALRSKEYYQQELGSIMAEHELSKDDNLYMAVAMCEYAMLAGRLQAVCEGLLRDSPDWGEGEDVTRIKVERYDMLLNHLRSGIQPITQEDCPYADVTVTLMEGSEGYEYMAVECACDWFDHWDEPKEV
jgi:hypothetical protein